LGATGGKGVDAQPASTATQISKCPNKGCRWRFDEFIGRVSCLWVCHLSGGFKVKNVSRPQSIGSLPGLTIGLCAGMTFAVNARAVHDKQAFSTSKTVYTLYCAPFAGSVPQPKLKA
jgi:hypothetical protein